jgi:uncharacterized PurR-regulated membrane protein YhhQ (DUF165 family)
MVSKSKRNTILQTPHNPTKTNGLILAYLLAIIIANLLITQFGPSVAVINAFLFIGLDLTVRDYLHEQWQHRYLWSKMLLLIAAGSLLSWVLNHNAGPIALASFVAFAGAGVADTLVYMLLGKKSRFLKINGSNVASSAVDSLLFPLLAFGFPLLWLIVLGQFIAKVGGGFIWSIVLVKLIKERS